LTDSVYADGGMCAGHLEEFWKCGSAREFWNSWERVRSIWKGKSSRRRTPRASCPARRVGVGAAKPQPGGHGMPRQKSFVTAIRELVRKELSQQIGNLLGSIGGAGTTKRRRRRRGRRGPGRPRGSKTRRRRGRPPKTA